MQRMKKCLSTVVTLSMVFGVLQPSTLVLAASNDVNGHWAEKTITAWQDANRINGYEDGSFRPDQAVTRAEFVRLMNQALALKDSGSVDFSDVKSSDWFYDDVAIAIGEGYCSGFPDGTFLPQDSVTRAQAAVFVANAKGLSANASAASKATDFSAIPSWAAGSVGAVLDAGYMTGYPDGSFKADGKLTRAEAVSTLDRILGGTTDTEVDTTKNVTVDEPAKTIKDQTIEGNLIISSKVGEGSVMIENVIINGDLVVEGGGANSIHVKDSEIKGTIQMNKAGARVVLEGATEVNDVNFTKVSKLDRTNFTGNVGDIVIAENLGNSSPVTINVPADSLTIEKTAYVQIQRNITNVTVDSDAENSRVDIADGVTVSTLTADAKTSIVGYGTIKELIVNVSGVTKGSNVKVTKTTTASGVKAPEVNNGGGGGGSTGDTGSKDDGSYSTYVSESQSDKTYTKPVIIRLGTSDLTFTNVKFEKGVTVVQAPVTTPVAARAESFSANSGILTFGGTTTFKAIFTVNVAAKIMASDSIEFPTMIANQPTTLGGAISVTNLQAKSDLNVADTVAIQDLVIETKSAEEASIVSIAGKITNITATGTGTIGELNLSGNAAPTVTVPAGTSLAKFTLSGSASATVNVAAGAKVDSIVSTSDKAGTVINGEAGSVGSILVENKDTITSNVPDAPVEEAKLSSITIKTQPTKLTYDPGETIDTTGMVVEGVYKTADGKEATKTINTADCVISPTVAAKGQETITVTYNTFSATFTITVTDAPPVSKTVSVANQNGALKAEEAGTAIFGVTTTNIADSKEVTVAWTTGTAPTGIAATAPAVSNNASVLTMTATAGQTVEGSYEFVVAIDGTTSSAMQLVIDAKASVDPEPPVSAPSVLTAVNPVATYTASSDAITYVVGSTTDGATYAVYDASTAGTIVSGVTATVEANVASGNVLTLNFNDSNEEGVYYIQTNKDTLASSSRLAVFVYNTTTVDTDPLKTFVSEVALANDSATTVTYYVGNVIDGATYVVYDSTTSTNAVAGVSAEISGNALKITFAPTAVSKTGTYYIATEVNGVESGTTRLMIKVNAPVAPAPASLYNVRSK